MTIDNATFVVQRGDTKFSCLGSELSTKLQDDDLMICQVGGTLATATKETILNSELLFTDPEVDGFDEILIDSIPNGEVVEYITATNKAFYALTRFSSDKRNIKIYKTFDLKDPFEYVKTIELNSDFHSCLFFGWVHNKFVFSFRLTSATRYYFGEWGGSANDPITMSNNVMSFTTTPIWKTHDNITYGYEPYYRDFWIFNSTGSILDPNNWLHLDVGKTVDNDQMDSPENVYYSKELDTIFLSGGNSALWAKSITGLTGHDNEILAYYATTAFSKLNYIAAKPGLTVAANDSSWTSIYWTDQDPTTQHTWTKVEIGSAFRVKYLGYEADLGLFFIHDANDKVHISSDGITWSEVANGTGSADWTDSTVSFPETGQVLVVDKDIVPLTAYFTGYYFKVSGVPDDSLFVVTDGDNGHKSVTGAQVKALL